MNPQAALITFGLFILAALLVDSRQKPSVSIGLWIPVAWLTILASRPVVSWFNPIQGPLDLLQGEAESPIDRNILLVFIVLGLFTLLTRQLSWTKWLKANPWVVVFFLYCGLSTIWSDFPGIAFKRWIRALGALVMIVIVLSDRAPVTAIRALLRRCSYFLVPLSVVLARYYRSLGVTYNQWTGTEYLIGVTTNKNALGRLCLISALFMLWDLISTRDNERGKSIALNRLIAAAMLVLTVWLLVQSASSTSLGSFIIGTFVLLALGFSPVRRQAKHLGTLLLLMATLTVALDSVFNLKEMAVGSLGRDMTLTDRTYIWSDLLALGTNPVVGVGYDSFWLGERLQTFALKHLVAEAHNGYLEAYLELGIVGVSLLLGLLWSLFRKAKQLVMHKTTFEYGRLRLTMLAVFLIYNLTEAGYKVTTLMAFVLLLVAAERPETERVVVGAVDVRQPGRMRAALVASRWSGMQRANR